VGLKEEQTTARGQLPAAGKIFCVAAFPLAVLASFFLDMLYVKDYHPFRSSLKEYIIKVPCHDPCPLRIKNFSDAKQEYAVPLELIDSVELVARSIA
jgi:hypothetical protein